ncbi:ATP-binding protein [Streptomyces dioscori]|uniref:ATP-binding protein n=1 Tax=Streptomyces dioscori TaxID=2109333 RepID=A0A2P8Q9S6_9ACTN|nr:type VII secretion protein EccCa [Streptomyces dioscori]PSM42995.1 ATP-binding protein [Streptomyces dioscori]
MSKIAFHRPARTFPPSVPEQHVALPAPPQKPQEAQAAGWLYMLLPLLSSVSMAAYMVTFGRPWMILLGIGFVVVSVVVTALVRTQSRKSTRIARLRQRDRYVEYLTDIRAQARASAAAQRAVSAFLHPSPRRLWALATGRRRVWERRPSDEDFLRLRLGRGLGVPAMRLASGKRSDPTAEFETQSQRAADRLLRDHAHVGHEPAWVDLAATGVLSVHGPADRTGPLVGALLLQLGVLHAPDDVQVIALTSEHAPWSWAKWLPHIRHADSLAGRPVLAQDIEGIEDVLTARIERARVERAENAANILRRETKAERHLVVVLDGFRPDAPWAGLPLVTDLLTEAGPATGLHVVCTVTKESEEPGRVDVRARVGANGSLTLESRVPALTSAVTDATADVCPSGLGEQTARALAPLRLAGEREQVLSRTVSLPDMLGLQRLEEVEPPSLWRAPDDEALLRLPVGVTGDGEQLLLDLKESALGGVGPHGLVVGATGSGKSELLRTLVTGLTLTHSPEHLSFVLVDFKGGATFAGVTELPHVAGLITNLSDDLALVDRVRAALQGEQTRRQQMLRAAGNVDSVREYQILQAQGATDTEGRPLDPMPYLMIMVDEFGELLSQRPDFIELFVQIGRVGRSLGMHLLLATQRLDEGRLRGLESHLSYRICLRTFSAAESRAVIGTTDAYRLPSIPGSAYLKVDESVYERFRVAHVSGTHHDGSEVRTARPVEVAPIPFGFRTARDARSDEDEAAETPAPVAPPEAGRRSEMQVAVDRMMSYGDPVHQVWLPPLPSAVELDSVLGPLTTDTERGLRSEVWPQGGGLNIPLGVVDLPAQQEQRVLHLDLAGAHGHIAVVGAPQSGKSTLLRSAVLSAALLHTPEELQFVCVDFGGGSLSGVEGAPHVSGVASRHDEAQVRRALSVVRGQVEERERMFRELKADTADDFRRMRAEGALPDGVNGADIVLVVDNWGALRGAVEEAEETLVEIATRGLGVGVHLLLSANRWNEIRANLRDNITGRLELRLNEPGESEISRPAARALKAVLPGRGLIAPGLTFHAALPRADGLASADGLAKAQEELVNDLWSGWRGPEAEPLRVLGELVTPADLAAAYEQSHPDGGAPAAADVPVGLRETDLGPAAVNLETDGPHFLVLGDAGSGKTEFLRMWMRGMVRRRSSWDVRFIVIDYRRGLLEAVPEEYLGAQAGESQAATAYLEQFAEKLRERMPPPGISARELRERSWWSGPELYLVVDDYDLVAGAGLGSRNPLAPLVDSLAQAADIGFHLVLGRRTGGATRSAMSDPFVGRLRELGTGGLILSGDPREGVLLGDQRAARQPPGRGTLVSRKGGAVVIQTVHDPADAEATPSS